LVGLKKYKIDIFNLPSGEHEYEFDFKPDFFQNFENSLIEKGQGLIKVYLDKSETFLELSFKIEGSLELICDRSLDVFNYPVSLNKNLILKFGEDPDVDEEDEIAFIPRNTQTVHLEQYIYEFLSLEVPMKKLHPRFMNEEEDEEQEEKLIYSSHSESKDQEDENIDPRWKELMNLKRDKKNKSK